jgi:hypothetical protein
VPRRTFDAIWSDLVELMPLGVRDDRIDTVRPEHSPERMGRPPRVDRHGGEVYVYRRHEQACLVCGGPVRKEDVAGRKLWALASLELDAAGVAPRVDWREAARRVAAVDAAARRPGNVG